MSDTKVTADGGLLFEARRAGIRVASTIREADRIFVLQDGAIVESGTHDELLQNGSGLYRRLSELQFDLAATA